MTVYDWIEINPKIMLGKPVIKGSRIAAELILRKIAEAPTSGLCSMRIRTSLRPTFTLRYVMQPTRLRTKKSCLRPRIAEARSICD